MYLANLNTDQFKEAVVHIDTVLIPIGSIEAHGRHCPLSTDKIIPERIADDLEKVLGDKLLIAPAIPYGYSPDLAYFPGTVHVSGETLAAYVTEVAASWLRWGIKNVVFLNGHGGNVSALTLAADKLVAKGAKVVIVNWWLHYAADILTICDSQGHAGEDETSTVLAIDADLVDMTKAGKHEKKFIGTFKMPGQVTYTYPDAMNGDATKATAEKGEAIYKIVNTRIVELLTEFWAGRYVR